MDVFESIANNGMATIRNFGDGFDYESFTDSAVEFADMTITASSSDALFGFGNGNTLTLKYIMTILVYNSKILTVLGIVYKTKPQLTYPYLYAKTGS